MLQSVQCGQILHDSGQRSADQVSTLHQAQGTLLTLPPLVSSATAILTISNILGSVGTVMSCQEKLKCLTGRSRR